MDSETVRHGRWEQSLKLKRVELFRGDYMTSCLFIFSFKLTITRKRRQGFMLHKQLTASAASFAKAITGFQSCLSFIWLNKFWLNKLPMPDPCMYLLMV